MADVEDNTAGFSLADLADLDISDIEEIRFQVLPQMTAEFEVTKAEMSEDDKDGERRFKIEFENTVREVLAVITPGVDKESIPGKSQTERYFIKPGEPQEKVLEAIGRVRAFLTDIGAESNGPLGIAIANSKGTTFRGNITHRADKDDKSVVYSRLKLDPKKS